MPIFKKLRSIVTRTDLRTGLDMDFDKPYLLLLVPVGETDPTIGEFSCHRGRKTTFDYIHDQVITGNYNLTKSFILSGGITFGNEVSIYTFYRLCYEKFRYCEVEDMDYVDDMAISTSIEEIDKRNLDILYAEEISADAKG